MANRRTGPPLSVTRAVEEEAFIAGEAGGVRKRAISSASESSINSFERRGRLP